MAHHEALYMPIGLALSILGYQRSVEWEKFKSEETRYRRLAFFASTTMDHKNKTDSDLYPFPWEGVQNEPATFDQGMMAMKRLQEELNAKKDAIKTSGTG